MLFLTVIFLAVIQGLTEFLPVSSSGHLALLSHFCGIDPDASISLGIVLHAGSLIAICAFYSPFTKKRLFRRAYAPQICAGIQNGKNS